MLTDIQRQLETLAEMKQRRANVAADYALVKEAMVPPEVQQALADVDAAYQPVETVTIRREELEALRQRVAELEARLAAMPEDALRRYMRYSDGTSHRYSADNERLDRAAIAVWLGMLAGKQAQS